jgi:serine/threonine protein kinase
MAPEVLANKGYTEKADIYGFALIMYHLLSGKEPYW